MPKADNELLQRRRSLRVPTHAKKLPPMGKYASNLPPPAPVILFPALETPKDVLKFIGEQDKAVSWYSHVPPAAARADKATWAGPVDPAKKLVMKTAANAAQKICAILCGGSEEAGTALWDRVRFDGADFWGDDGPAQRTLAHTVAECYVKAPKSSIEKRVLRACLTSLKREVDIPELSVVVTELTVAAKSFTRGRMDLEALRLGATLAREPRTLKHFDATSIDAVVSTILRTDNVSFLSWGVKRVRLDGQAHVIPAIMRRRTRAVMFEHNLHETTLHHRGNDTVSESTFYRIASTITTSRISYKHLSYLIPYMKLQSYV